MRYTVILLLILTSFSKVDFAQNSPPSEVAKALAEKLNTAKDDDRPIVLTEGTDFLQAPGTVIFLSRELGQNKLIGLARSGENERAFLFLPQYGAWITQTKENTYQSMRIDSRYFNAAQLAGLSIEYWHTHNNTSLQSNTPEEFVRKSISWAMPSDVDLRQFYIWSHILPSAKVRWFIAGVHGVTSYWNDNPSWAAAIYIEEAVQTEARVLQREVGELSLRKDRPFELKDLSEFALNHKGFANLRFEPIPDLMSLK